jgi:hypothetical protein
VSRGIYSYFKKSPLILRRHAKHGLEGLVSVDADASRLAGFARSHLSMRGSSFPPSSPLPLLIMPVLDAAIATKKMPASRAGMMRM